MRNKRIDAQFLGPANDYIAILSASDQGLIAADIDAMMSGDFESVSTKQLRGSIRELIVGHHRLTYFSVGNQLYFVRGFRKKSRKTPKKEIDYAEKIYKIVKQKI